MLEDVSSVRISTGGVDDVEAEGVGAADKWRI
jgi:hypothetical protein